MPLNGVRIKEFEDKYETTKEGYRVAKETRNTAIAEVREQQNALVSSAYETMYAAGKELGSVKSEEKRKAYDVRRVASAVNSATMKLDRHHEKLVGIDDEHVEIMKKVVADLQAKQLALSRKAEEVIRY